MKMKKQVYQPTLVAPSERAKILIQTTSTINTLYLYKKVLFVQLKLKQRNYEINTHNLYIDILNITTRSLLSYYLALICSKSSTWKPQALQILLI